MRRVLPAALVSASLSCSLFTGIASGEAPAPLPEGVGEPAAHAPHEPLPEKWHVPDPDHTFHRAGYPNIISKWARPTDTGKYCGYYVGGGAAFRGEPRYPCEGTWGWDYCGWHRLPHRVMLCWWHGRKYQGGSGAYKTDGPVFPEPLYVPQVGHAQHHE
jgi:hypothetical protein